MKRTSKRWRRTELVLWALGVILLGGALASTAARWSYQAEQERALFSAERPEPDLNAAGETPRRDPLPEPPEMFGPVPAPNSVPRTVVGVRPQPQVVEEPQSQPKPKAPRKRIETPVDPDAFGRIEIPRIGVRAIIRKGADEETLARAVGLVPGGARPGEAGNVILAGHRDTFFRPLRKIRVEDRIRVFVPPDEYIYQVESMRVVSPEETDVLQSKGADELTLVTCYPFRYIGPAPDRFIVSAKRVQ